MFLDFRTNFTDSGNFIPFIGLKLGYSFVPAESFASMGFYFSPTLGVKYLVSDTNAVNLSIGYSCQYADIYVYDFLVTTITKKKD